LRPAGMAEVEATRRISLSDLEHDVPTGPLPPAETETAAPVADARRTTTVSVARAMKRQEYSVPVQTREAPSAGDPAKVTQNF
jgi:hypothetical protein